MKMGTEKMAVVVVEIETTPSLMTAKEARSLAMAERSKEVDKILPKALDHIRKMAESGNLTCYFKCTTNFGGDTRPAVAKKLEALGYKVSASYVGGYSEWCISW